MSMTSAPSQIPASLKPHWDDFLHDIEAHLSIKKDPLRLFLPHPLLPALLDSLAKSHPARLIVQIPNNVYLPDNLSWHLINFPLSDQEQEGIIHTPLSLAYHTLMSESLSKHVAITIKMMNGQIPDPKIYHRRIVRITRGQRIGISSLAETLVRAGYIRYAKQASRGGFFIQGDTIQIFPPNLDNPYQIEVFGPVVEKITHADGRRTYAEESIALNPAQFPKETVSCKEALRNTACIILDSPTPDIQTPYEILHAKIPILLSKTSRPQKVHASPIGIERALELIGKLTPGKPAVHADHGIGIYEGLERRTIGNAEIEYIILRYAGGDSIAVPVPFAHKVSPYIGETAPAVYRLGGTLWSKTKKRAQEDAAAFAKELLELAKKRNASKRSPYVIGQELEEKLESSFPYEMTADQKTAWEDVLRDMEKDIPMDRLIIGDVGFGKTELAIRAAQHAYANGKQVAVLAPTTLLVQQHVDTFASRLPDIAESIFLLSRFTPAKDIKKAKQHLAEGKSAIVIGTHSILSHSIPWKNLSLLIVDEEQRFGVRQKEQLKKIRASVDIISLSATPIPRTLSLALSGMRKLSVIATAPKGRKDIATTVAKQDIAKIKEAIEQELSRNGQTYLVSSKIRNLAMIQEMVRAAIPSAKTAIAHAQLSDEELSGIIHAFDTKEVDVLISSSIVENGLDLPNVNTMIVWDAPHFGLAQLYQLRGRIGRRERQGHAYFLYGQERLTDPQRERLTALTEASRVGSGWDIARRDLEMRGAGNMMGREQSGSANEVGMQLYLDMVEGRAEEKRADIRILLPAYIPSSYIEDADERTTWYVRLSRAQAISELAQRVQALQEQYGIAPQEVQNIIRMISLEILATKNGIIKIATSDIKPSDEDPYVKIEVTAQNPLPVLQKLSSIQNENGTPARWQSRENILSWNTDAITPKLIDQFITSLTE